MKSIRCFVQIASLVAVAFVGTACGKISIPANLIMDPAKTNEFSVNALGQTLAIPLTGGLAAKVILDTSKLLSPQGIVTTIKADNVEIAGPSVTFAGLPVGTLCARENVADPTVATAYIKLFGQSIADFHFAAEATTPLLAALIPGGILPLSQDVDDLPLNIDFKKLLHLDLGGLSTSGVIAGTVPADIPLIGGAPFTLTVSMKGSSKAATGPLLDECRPFFDAN